MTYTTKPKEIDDVEYHIDERHAILIQPVQKKQGLGPQIRADPESSPKFLHDTTSTCGRRLSREHHDVPGATYEKQRRDG